MSFKGKHMQKTSIILVIGLVVSILFSSFMVSLNSALQSENEELKKEDNRLLGIDSVRGVHMEAVDITNQNLVDWINTHNMLYHQSINQVKIENVSKFGFSPFGGLTIKSTISMDILNSGTNILNGLVVTATNEDSSFVETNSVVLKPLNASESRKVSIPVYWYLGDSKVDVIVEVLLNGTLITTGTY